jgi:hypothetical protein
VGNQQQPRPSPSYEHHGEFYDSQQVVTLLSTSTKSKGPSPASLAFMQVTTDDYTAKTMQNQQQGN